MKSPDLSPGLICEYQIKLYIANYKGGGTNMLRKYVTDMVPRVGLLKYVTDFQKMTSGEIVKNVKYVTEKINVTVPNRYYLF